MSNFDVVRRTLARYSLALGSDWGDTELWRDHKQALAALDRIEKAARAAAYDHNDGRSWTNRDVDVLQVTLRAALEEVG